jgi:hypothetical protein
MSQTITPVLYDLTNLQAPASGITHAMKVIVTFNSATEYSFAPADWVNSIGLVFNPQAVRINNAENTVGFTISETIYGWSQYIAAGETTTFNFPGVQNPEFTFLSDDGSITVQFDFFDFPAFAFIDQNPNTSQGTPIAPGSEPINVVIDGGSITSAVDYNGASVTSTGASQTLVAANANRKYLLVGAPSAAPVWVNFTGGTASAGGADCFEIQAGGFYESNLIVPSNAVTVFCATTGLTIPCVEG